MSYNSGTEDKVIKILNDAIKYRKRLRVFLGDSETGRDWMEEYDTIGYIGISTGSEKVPLMIRSNRSSGGGAIPTDCIVKITINKEVAYRHPKYHLPELTTEFPLEIGLYEVHADRVVQARFDTEVRSQNYIRFLKGERNNK